MRVTSSLFVAALIRRAALAGAQGVVVRHGSDEAGAIFVTIDRLDGTVDLYSPAPQSLITDDDDLPADRLFTRLAERALSADVDLRLAKEIQFDPDVWLIAIEDREGRSFVEIAKG